MPHDFAIPFSIFIHGCLLRFVNSPVKASHRHALCIFNGCARFHNFVSVLWFVGTRGLWFGKSLIRRSWIASCWPPGDPENSVAIGYGVWLIELIEDVQGVLLSWSVFMVSIARCFPGLKVILFVCMLRLTSVRYSSHGIG